MKKNMIINFLTLSVTALLLVFLIMAWYVENKLVSANNIFGESAGEEYTLKLERGKFKYGTNTTTGKTDYYWEWTETNDMTFIDIQPEDAFFFRIKIETDGTHNFNLKFDDVVSSLIDGSLYAYKNSNLVEYEKTSDTVVDDNKQYYSAAFNQESVTVGDYVKPYTYYVKDTTDDKKYVLTSDDKFKSGTTYYKAKFLLDEIPNLSLRSYYTKKTDSSTTPNAIGYKYAEGAYSYMYPLYSDNTVKIKSDDGTKEILYKYNTTSKEVELDDYLIEDVIKAYSIGTSYTDDESQVKAYGINFVQNDSLFEYSDDAYVDTEDTTYNFKKTYYYYHPTYGYVKLASNSFASGVTYYELDKTKKPSVKYSTNALLKNSSFDFDTSKNNNGVTYYYFALEFNDLLSLVTIDGVKSSNCYLHQCMSIRNLEVTMESDDE